MKTMIMALVLCLLVAGCGGSRGNCDYAAEIEYGKENVVYLGYNGRSYVYLVRTPTEVLVIYKGNDTNPKTTSVKDVTEFVGYKGEPK